VDFVVESERKYLEVSVMQLICWPARSLLFEGCLDYVGKDCSNNLPEPILPIP